jgi:hypothetical protein
MAGDRIDSVQMEYELPDGRIVSGPRHGGSGGRLRVFSLDRDEFVTGLSGRSGDTVDSLRIHTNRRSSELFGGGGGSRDFRVEVPRGNQAVGFVGRAGSVLDAVGLTYERVESFRRRGPLTFGQPASGDVSETALAGGGGGSPFSDRDASPDARLAEIRVYAGDRVDAVQAVYVLDDGRTIEGPRHGGGGGVVSVFRLDRGEVVTGLSGRHGDVIDSLRIHTNRRSSELFGGGGGSRDYRVEVPAGAEATGFAGRAGRYLDAVGLTYASVGARRGGPGRRPGRFGRGR